MEFISVMIMWSIVGLLFGVLLNAMGLVALNREDNMLYILACGPIMWMIVLIKFYKK